MDKRYAVIAAVLASGALIAAAAPSARAHDDAGAIVAGALFGAVVASTITAPHFVYGPPVGYYSPPPPTVVYEPAPTYYPAPVYYAAPPRVVYYDRPGWRRHDRGWHDRGWRHEHRRWHDDD